MSKHGARYPEVVDLVSSSDEYVKLFIIQAETLTNNLYRKFQDKLNNYMSFALDGQMHKKYPDTIGLSVIISIDFLENESETIIDFLKKTKNIFLKEGVTLEWRVVELGEE